MDKHLSDPKIRMNLLNKTLNHKKNENIDKPDYIKIKYFSSRKVTINKVKIQVTD